MMAAAEQDLGGLEAMGGGGSLRRGRAREFGLTIIRIWHLT